MNTIIIVPYRERPQHLTKFIGHMHAHYGDMPICIVEQAGDRAFNRAKLLNIGFLENKNNYTHFVFHDIDMLPMHVNYNVTYKNPVIQMAKSEIQPYGYLGGVTRFSRSAFMRVGGYNNEYYHRAEDNEMMFNLRRMKIEVIEKPGVFDLLPHERKEPEFDPVLWEKSKQPRAVQNQLGICFYSTTQTMLIGNAKHITVSL